MVGRIVVDDVLKHCALLHSICDLKAPQLNVQSNLIQEFRLNKFKWGHNTAEVTKNICSMKAYIMKWPIFPIPQQ